MSTPGRFEAWVAAAYERWGLRGAVLQAMAASAVFILPWSVVAVVMSGVVTEASMREIGVSIALNLGLATVGMSVAIVAELRELKRIDAWTARGRPAAEAAEVLRLVTTAPERWTAIGLGGYLVLWIPVFSWWFTEISGSLAFGLLLVVGGVFVATPVVWPVTVFSQELAHRPMLADLRSQFPDLIESRRRQSLRRRSLLPVPTLTLSTGYAVGLYVTGFDEPTAQTAVALALSFGFAAVYAVILWGVVGEAALRPIDDLTEGVRRIADGDLGQHVPGTSGDEFGVLARTFNQMSDRLTAQDAEMRATRARILVAADEGRHRVERDMHAGAQQYLVLVELKLGLLAKAVAGNERAADMTADALSDLGHVLSELRTLSHGLYPEVLISEGLTAAIESVGGRSTLPVAVVSNGVGRMAPEVEAAIYFCCVEAIQNAAKHAGSDASVTVTLGRDNGQLTFAVTDNGQGYETARVAPSAGTQNMADRIGALGGSLAITSQPGVGTSITGSVPMEAT